MAERRQDFHQSRVGENLSPTNSSLQSAFHQTAAYLQTQGFSQVDAVKAATLRFYTQLGNQTHLLAFMDCFHVIAVITLLAAPLVLLTRNFKLSGKVPEGH
jgi:DHA2 family multidrug resistance protein